MLTNPDCIKPFNQDDVALCCPGRCAAWTGRLALAGEARLPIGFAEGERAVEGLSFGLYRDDEKMCPTLRAVISFWHLRIGEQGHHAIMLGPIAVEPSLTGYWIGRNADAPLSQAGLFSLVSSWSSLSAMNPITHRLAFRGFRTDGCCCRDRWIRHACCFANCSQALLTMSAAWYCRHHDLSHGRRRVSGPRDTRSAISATAKLQVPTAS